MRPVNKPDFEPLRSKAWIQSRINGYKQALAAQESGTNINQTSLGEISFNCGRDLIELGQYKEAIYYFNKAIQLNFIGKCSVHWERGLALARLGEDNAAIEDFTQAVALSNKPVPPHFIWNVPMRMPSLETPNWLSKIGSQPSTLRKPLIASE